MIYYFFDASAAIEFYRPKATYPNRKSYETSLGIIKHITKQKLQDNAILFIPSFCIAEVRNILAKWYFRYKNIFKSKAHYESIFWKFISHVHDRKFFYSYDLNRYHNINTTLVAEAEHITNTEFDASGLPAGTNKEVVNKKLKERNLYDHAGSYYLSTFDILIISMGMELKKITGEEVYLLTKDKRLALISSTMKEFPNSLYWSDIRIDSLPKK